MKSLKLTLLFFAIVFSLSLFAQDTIVKKDTKRIICKVQEIDSANIIYLRPDYPKDRFFIIEIDQVSKIIFENGLEKTFTDSIPTTEENDYKKNAIKVHLLAPIMGHVSFSYERSLAPGRSLELGAGYIYGFPYNGGAENGFILKAGLKIMRKRKSLLDILKYVNILNGLYIKPEFIFTTFSSAHRGNNDNKIKQIATFSILLEFGRQLVFTDLLMVDYYFGLGYGYTNDGQIPFYYSHMTSAAPSFPISITSGIRFGFLFK